MIGSAALESMTITGNQARGGAAGEGGKDGQGLGGGVYVDPAASVCVDLATLIAKNYASTAGDDMFGKLYLC